MAEPDLYAILDVSADADILAIRVAYRRLARVHHPDVGGCSSRMTKLNAAWAVLSNPRQRRAYDLSRRDAETERGLGPIAARVARASGGPATAGTKVGFGQYTGWSLADIARHDPEYLAWLATHPSGRRYRPEIDALRATGTARAESRR